MKYTILYKYNVTLNYLNGKKDEVIEFTTDKFDFIMDQYSRNRDPFKFEVNSKELSQ